MTFKRDTIRLAIAAGLPLIICAAWYVWLQHQISHQQERNRILETEIARIDPLIRDIKDLEKWKEKLLSLMRSYEQIRHGSASGFIEILPELSKRIPRGIALQKVDYSMYDRGQVKRELYFEGETLSKEHVQLLQQEMNNSEVFLEPALEFIEDPAPGSLLKFGMRLREHPVKELLSEEDS